MQTKGNNQNRVNPDSVERDTRRRPDDIDDAELLVPEDGENLPGHDNGGQGMGQGRGANPGQEKRKAPPAPGNQQKREDPPAPHEQGRPKEKREAE